MHSKDYYELKIFIIRKAIGICNKLKPGKCKSKNISRLFKKLNNNKRNLTRAIT